ncbi:MAG: head-tail adaptor protein [Tropicimonas sp.]|uniref:head-tail adaptor protein n=1 Tax=Tropicimonas sp. TaxID=2067044 RepID=UPI003A87DE48
MSGGFPDLNRRLVLETLDRVPDDAGGFVESWRALGTLWAEVRAGTGRKTEEDLLTLSYVPYRITVRAAPPDDSRRPRPEQRFREGSRVYRILAVADAGIGGRFLECRAREEESSA